MNLGDYFKLSHLLEELYLFIIRIIHLNWYFITCCNWLERFQYVCIVVGYVYDSAFLECVTVTFPTLYNLEEVIFFEIFLDLSRSYGFTPPLPFSHDLKVLVVIGRFDYIWWRHSCMLPPLTFFILMLVMMKF